MNADRLLELYEQISEAPDAIARLRRFVLDLAVRGKLVAQDPSEEPASELLKQIAAEKARLVSAGEIRKLKLLEPIDEAPFKLPASWQWARLGEIAELVRGISFPASEKSNEPEKGRIPCFRSGNIQAQTVWDDFIYVRKSALKSAGQMVRPGDVLISIANSYALVGKCSIISENPFPATFGAFLAAIRLHLILPEYAKAFLTSDFSAKSFRIGSSQTTNIANITFSTIRGHPFAIPPLAEQHRIVAKVDELMALCDRLEEARKTREETRDRLTAASLARLTAPETTEQDFPAHARFALDTLSALTTRPNQIKTLRQTILNLAVRGKLVAQDPGDEPAKELLKRIAAEKTKRVVNGTMRAQKALEPVAVGEQSFDIPNNWEWARLGEVIKLWNGLAFKSSDFGKDGVPVIRIGDLQDGAVDLSKSVRVSEKVAASVTEEIWIPRDALLLAMSGATTGKTAFNLTGQSLLLNQRVGRIEPFQMNIHFIRIFFETIVTRNLSISLGSAIPNLSAKQINETAIPLPPLAEQHRIVAKVDALMALCDRLEAALAQADTTRTRLLEALLHEALEPASGALEAAE